MDDLIKGYRRFRAVTWRDERSRFEELSRLGQRPRALVIACSDSRTDPQMVFNARPGELFVVRNIANLVPPYAPDRQPQGVSSAIEFAVRSLRVRDIVVMGHAMCGGIQALLHGAPAETIRFPRPMGAYRRAGARTRHGDAAGSAAGLLRTRIGAAVAAQPAAPFRGSPSLSQAGALKLHGCLFDIRSGILERLGEDHTFHPIPEAEHD